MKINKIKQFINDVKWCRGIPSIIVKRRKARKEKMCALAKAVIDYTTSTITYITDQNILTYVDWKTKGVRLSMIKCQMLPSYWSERSPKVEVNINQNREPEFKLKEDQYNILTNLKTDKNKDND